MQDVIQKMKKLIIAITVLVLSGCTVYRTREFVPVEANPSYENWTLETDIFAYKGSGGHTKGNHNYFVSVEISTWSGGNGFKTSQYRATIQSIRLFSIINTEKEEIILGELVSGSSDGLNRNMYLSTKERVYIEPATDKTELVVVVKYEGEQKSEKKNYNIILRKSEKSFPFIKMR